jgi:hypothetical protein
MKTTLLSLVLVLFVSACVHKVDSSLTGTSQFSFAAKVVAKEQTVRLGDPIIVSVSVSNQAPQVKEVDRTAAAFGGFEITDSDGKTLPYVGEIYQVRSDKVAVQPHSTVTIDDALDLTEKYLFQKAGRYSIRFGDKSIGLSDSPAIAIEVTAGRLSEIDDFVASLLPVCPNGWYLSKGHRVVVTPFGPGFAINFMRNPMQREVVDLWFTKEEVKVDLNQQPPFKMEYLGHARGQFVYGSVGENAPALWPTAIVDISRALRITKQ